MRLTLLAPFAARRSPQRKAVDLRLSLTTAAHRDFRAGSTAQHEHHEVAMPLSVTCSACNQRYKLKEEYAGKRVQCPACKAAMVVPVPTQAISPKLAPETTEHAVPGNAPGDSITRFPSKFALGPSRRIIVVAACALLVLNFFFPYARYHGGWKLVPNGWRPPVSRSDYVEITGKTAYGYRSILAEDVQVEWPRTLSQAFAIVVVAGIAFGLVGARINRSIGQERAKVSC